MSTVRGKGTEKKLGTCIKETTETFLGSTNMEKVTCKITLEKIGKRVSR